MAFLGKTYVQTSVENYDGFINSFGQNLPEEIKQAMLNHKSTAKLTQNGDSYTLATSQPQGQKEITFKSGVPFSETNPGGRVSQTTITLDGNTLTHVQNFDAGSITQKRVWNGDEMVTTYTSSTWDGVATKVYKAQ